MTEKTDAPSSTKLKELTEAQKAFLERCETLFQNRYTEDDKDFMAVHSTALKDPPIVPFCSGRGKDRRLRYEDRFRNHQGDRQHYGGDNRYRDRSDHRERNYERRRPYESGSRDYDRNDIKRPRYDNNHYGRRY